MSHIYLKNRSYSVSNLPSEPSLLVELLDLCHNDNANFEMFSSAIRKDISLTAKIIQVANSPAYRQWNKINDIRRMLIVLGLTNVRNIVTTCAIQQFFAKFTKEFNRHVQLTWLRSLVCANLSEKLAKLVGYGKSGEAFLAGLLHQVGILLLLLNRKEEYLPLLYDYYQHTEIFQHLEQERLNIDHCELGAALVETWQLDSFIADAIQFQHAQVEELRNSPVLMKILAVASPLSSRNSARSNPEYLERAGLLFDLTESTILECLDEAVQKSRQMITDLGFSGRFYMVEDEENFFSEEQYETTQQELSKRIENATLSAIITRSEKTELIAFSKELRASFSALFRIEKLLLFKSDENRQKLTPVNDLEIDKLEEIGFSSDDENSLLVAAFNEKSPRLSFSGQPSIADRQIVRLLDTEGGYFLPVVHADTVCGVLVIGTSKQGSQELVAREPLLNLVAHEIGRKYALLEHRSEKTAGMAMVDFRKVAHEISNPLTIINNYLYMLGKKFDEEHPAREELSYIHEEIERVGNILLRAKDPSAPDRQKKELVDVNKLIRELDSLFNGSLYKTNRIESALLLDEELSPVACSQDKLKQVLMNIIKNAVEALGKNGRISISTRDNFYQNDKAYIELSITDNGPGIPPEILKSLFKPVTSSKEGHAGLGLSIVSNLVDEMSGSISCYSRQGQGTEFKILLPRTGKESETNAD